VNFVVARNPDPNSRLPYLVRLPIDGGLILKVRDTWPRTSRVFCSRVDDGWPADAEILEEVSVTLCQRRGVAIDLVLDRPRENRSRFVFTTLPSGREGIFWQTRKVVSTARPGARIPGRRASGLAELVIVVDSREQYPYRFSKQQATTVRAALQAGDYAVMSEGGSPVVVVERKSLADLAGALNNGTLVFELAKLAEMPRAAVVVEDRYGNLLKHAYTPGWVPAGHAGPRPGPLSRDPDPLPRDAPARRGVDIPVSRGGACRGRIRATVWIPSPGRGTASGLCPQAHPSEGAAEARRLARSRRMVS
jgi:ERCC4 domain-containing protein